MTKAALEVEEASRFAPTRMLASTLGRVVSAPASLFLGQETAPKTLMGPNAYLDEHEDAAKRMNRRHGKHLESTKLRLGGADTIDDLQRVWSNPRTTRLGKTVGTIMTPLNNLRSAITRADHYNPHSDVATVYNGMATQSAHELGHAVDFNKRKGLKRDMYAIGAMPERMVSIPGPLTHWQELAANTNVSRALKGEPDERVKEREAWRRLAPGYGTYAAASALGGLALHDHFGGGNKTYSGLYEGAKGLSDRMAFNVGGHEVKIPAGALLGLGAAGLGSVAGRGVAETRNLIDYLRHGSTKPKKEEDKA